MRRLIFWTAIVLPPLGAFLYFVLLADSHFSSAMYTAIKIAMLVIGYVGWKLSGRSVRKTFQASQKQVGLGVAAGCLLALLLFVAFFLLEPSLEPFRGTIQTKAASLFPLAWYIPLAALFSVFHALFEEWYWRGFVHAEIQLRVSTFLAPLLSALAFTAHHVIVLSQLFPGPLTTLFSVGIFFVGIFWAALFQHTRSLTPSWISHIFADAAIFTIGYLMMT